MSQQHASVSQGRICSDKFTCCLTEIEVADETFYFTKSQYTDTEPTRPSPDTTTPGIWQGRHWILGDRQRNRQTDRYRLAKAVSAIVDALW